MCHGQILDDSIRRARKPRRCEECGRTIEPGEKYRRFVYVASRGDPLEDTATCPTCSALGTALVNEGPDACWTLGEVRENLRELIRDGGAATARAVRAWVREGLEQFR
jgi:hypothetical protein